MSRENRVSIIEKFIWAMRAERRMYPDLYAGELADALYAAEGDDSADFHVRRDAPRTSKAVVDKIRRGSLQEQMLELFINSSAFGQVGASDDEIEVAMKRSHQSVSATRNTLVRKGYLVNSGTTRINRWGNEAIRWTWTGKRP